MVPGEGIAPQPTAYNAVALEIELPRHKKNGGPLGIRTLDPLIKSQLLYQLS